MKSRAKVEAMPSTQLGRDKMVTIVQTVFSVNVLVWTLLFSNSNFTEVHYNDVIMSTMASQITSLAIVCSTVYSRRRSKKTSKVRVTGLCEGNSPVTGEFPAQKASNAENVSIWWRHHVVVRDPVIIRYCCRSWLGAGQATSHYPHQWWSISVTYRPSNL